MKRAMKDESGFTMIELLVAAMIGTIILFAAFSLVDLSIQKQAETESRLDATQRGRQAMEQISRALRSQVCPGQGLATMIEAEDNKATFYSYLAATAPTTGPIKVQKRQLTYELPTATATRGAIYERVWENKSTTMGGLAFAATPDRTRVVADNLSRVGSLPIFRYSKYDPQSSPLMQALAPPIVDSDKSLIVQIKTTFNAFPLTSRRAATVATRLESKVFIRTADPTDPEHSPKCI
jgi:prepilin-type N-terminal cleavage/methylation domain-containing protein